MTSQNASKVSAFREAAQKASTLPKLRGGGKEDDARGIPSLGDLFLLSPLLLVDGFPAQQVSLDVQCSGSLSRGQSRWKKGVCPPIGEGRLVPSPDDTLELWL